MATRCFFTVGILVLLRASAANADEVRPFRARCVEGETHRYDGGNGKSVTGEAASFAYGWQTEKWGGLDISWSGGKTIVVGQLNATVVSNTQGAISAVWSYDLPALNIYSLVLDTVLGEAVYTQSQAATSGLNRSIKVRSQNLRCTIEWLH